MKLSRNKIRKIRKQQHQSVRKWKKQHRSSARRTTFRQSRRQNMTGILTKYPSKLNSVINRTLKKYIPRAELAQLKENYRKMRRNNRKRKQYVMTGGAGGDDAVQTEPQAPVTSKDSSSSQDNNMIETIVKAAVIAAFQSVTAINDKNTTKTNTDNNAATATPANPATANPATDPTATTATTATPDNKEATADNASSSSSSSGTNDKKKQPFSIGPEVKGDISIGTEIHECKDSREVWKLVQFLIRKGLPYYIQIEPKSGDKMLNKNDTSIFDLRRILYGKYTQDIKKIPENKRQLYIEAKEIVGIATGETIGTEQPGVFIYTGEKCQLLKESKDTTIQARIIQEDKNVAPTILTDSKRLYKIKGKDADVKPASIDTVARLQQLDSKNKIDTSEFRLQIAPMTQEELTKDAQNVAAGNDNPEVKVVVDESNTYVMNVDVGCKITSVQTLKRSLERARTTLESEKDKSKMAALEIFQMLSALLQNPEFSKNDGYADFKESIYNFTYKIHGSERKYGFTQLETFFKDNKDEVPPRLHKEFMKLLNLLGHGPAGANGDCLRFEGTSQSVYELSRIQTFEEDGKIVTKKTETLDNPSNMGGFMKQFSKLGESGKEKEPGAEGAEGDKAAEGATEGAKGATEGEKAAAAAAAAASGSAVSESDKSAVGNKSNDADMNNRPLSKDDIKEIDAFDSQRNRYKAYLIRKFAFSDLPDMNLVHFMGWGTPTDEYIPEPEAYNTINAEKSRILPRDDKSKTGNGGMADKTIDDVMKIYKDENISILEGKAKARAEEYNKEHPSAAEAKKRAVIASEISAVIAAQVVSKVLKQ